MIRRVSFPLCAAISLLACPKDTVAAPPNFVFFIADDVSWNDLGCYGNRVVKTPNLDRMAVEGRVFDNAYLTTSSCSPSRCSIITARYPHNTGAPELHTELPGDQFPFPLAMKRAGYYTALSGKKHMGNAVDRAFSLVSDGSGPGREGDWVQILRERPRDKPFFCWFASVDAHRRWQFTSDAPRYDPDEISVPPYLVDGPRTRQDLADYYHEVSRTDWFAGEIRKELERQSVAHNTYFIYCADNGRPFPRCKTRLYDSGIRTPLIVWRGAEIEPGRTRSLVSAMDFGPTILELAGIERHSMMQGVSFASVLEDPNAVIRDYAFAEHNWHVYQAHERMVRYRDWIYIRNSFPDRLNLCMESDPTFPSGAELWEARKQKALNDDQQRFFNNPQPAEELYQVSRDPYQLENLAADSRQRERLAELRGILDRWSAESGDTVPEDPTPDRQTVDGTRDPDFARGTLPGAGRHATRIAEPGPTRTFPDDATAQLTVAVVSSQAAFCDVDSNLSHFERLIEEAASKGARLVCFPELALTSYTTDRAVLSTAQPIPGPVTARLEATARRLNVYVSIGMAEKDGSKHYIAQMLVGPDGYLGKYRKSHPTKEERRCGFSPGRTFPTWTIDGFRFGILICFDGRHAQTIEAAKKAELDVIHHPHGNYVGGLGRDAEEWTRSKTVYFVERAVKARAHILINNSAGDTATPGHARRFSSGALAIDPLGQVIGRTKQHDRREKLLLVTLQRPQGLIPFGELDRLRDADETFRERFR